MAKYMIVYYDPNGRYIRTFTDFFHLEYQRVENDYGSMYIDFPPNISRKIFSTDGMFKILRSHDGKSNYVDVTRTTWFLRLTREKTDEQGKSITHVLAYGANQLIDRRIVAYKADTPQAKKSAVRADNLLKQIMCENFAEDATDADRNLSGYIHVSLENSNSAAPLITKSFAYQKILPLLQDICNESKEKGTYLCFDLVPRSDMPNKFRFNVYKNYRGVNRGSSSPHQLTFNIENGRLSYASMSYDYTEVRNFIYAGGSGEKSDRILKTAYDEKSIGLSPFNRCEDFVNSSDKNPNVVQSAANARLREAKSKFVINGHIQQTPTCIYGIHYGFGDIVSVKYKGKTIDVHLDAINVSVDENQVETISANSRNLDDSEY